MKINLLFKLFFLHLLGQLSKGDDDIHYENAFLSYGDVRTPSSHNHAIPRQHTPSNELLDLFRDGISSSKFSANIKYDMQVLHDLVKIMNSVPQKRSIYWINEFVRRVRFIFWKYRTYDEFRSSSHFPDMHRFAIPFELRIIEYTYFLRDSYNRLSFKELSMMHDESVEYSSPSNTYYRQPRSSSHTLSIDSKGTDMEVSDNSSSSSNDRINYAETEDYLILNDRDTPLSYEYNLNSAVENRLDITEVPFVSITETTSIQMEINDNNGTLSISDETKEYMKTNLSGDISIDNATQSTKLLEEDSSDNFRANFPEVDDTGFYDVLVKRSIKTQDNQEFLSEKFIKSHPISKFIFQPVSLNDDILKDLSEFFKRQFLNLDYSYLPNGFLKSYTEEVFDVLKKLTKRIDGNVDLMYNWIMYEQTIKNVEQMMRRLSFNETFKNSLPAHLQMYLVEAIHSDKNASSLLLDYHYNQFVRKDCGILSPSRTKRVINGSNTSNDDWPWIVYIKVNPKNDTSDIPTDCVGVLIAEQFVLSAAHCFNRLDLNCDITLSCQVKSYEIVAFFGLTNSSQVHNYPHSLASREVLSIDFHENYLNGNQFENDLVIIKLKKPIQLNEEATAVCLPSYEDIFYGMDGYVAGWGVTSRDERIQVLGGYVDGLKEAMVPIIPHSLCEKWLKKSFEQYDNIQEFKLVDVLCAGYEDGWADACKGDSGGPLVVESPDGVRTLAGIVSNGFGCGLPLRPGMYVDVARQAPWIKYKMAVLS